MANKHQNSVCAWWLSCFAFRINACPRTQTHYSLLYHYELVEATARHLHSSPSPNAYFTPSFPTISHKKRTAVLVVLGNSTASRGAMASECTCIEATASSALRRAGGDGNSQNVRLQRSSSEPLSFPPAASESASDASPARTSCTYRCTRSRSHAFSGPRPNAASMATRRASTNSGRSKGGAAAAAAPASSGVVPPEASTLPSWSRLPAAIAVAAAVPPPPTR